MAISCFKARIGNRITDREVVNHQSLLGRQVEIAVHFLIVECANSGRPQSECFGGKIQAVAGGAGFEMHVAVSTITMRAGGTSKIADHGERHACVTGEVLPEA